MGAPTLWDKAKEALKVYEEHSLKTYGEERTNAINFKKEFYSCCAYYAAAKQTKHKVDLSKLVELAKTKRKEIIDVGDAILKLMQAKTTTPQSGIDEKSTEMDDLTTLKENLTKHSVVNINSDNGHQYNQSEDDFQAWKQGILKRAVDAGFTKYKQYLTPSTN